MSAMAATGTIRQPQGVVRQATGTVYHWSYEAETVALVNALTTPPTLQMERLINKTIAYLKACGAWQVLDILYFMAAADSQSAGLNWVAPTGARTLIPTTSPAPTFTANQGYTGDGVASFLSTNFNPATAGGNYTQNSATQLLWNLTEGQFGTSITDCGTSGAAINCRTTSDTLLTRSNAAANDVTANAVAVGLLGWSRNNSANYLPYINGAAQASKARASAALSSVVARVCGVGGGAFSTRQEAIFCMGGALTATQVAAVYSAFHTYLAALGTI